jgi:hypothetical protein
LVHVREEDAAIMVRNDAFYVVAAAGMPWSPHAFTEVHTAIPAAAAARKRRAAAAGTVAASVWGFH